MTAQRSAVGAGESAPAEAHVLLTIDDFARRLKCSTRHLRRLIDAGRAPGPIRLGALLRFDSAVAEKWISDGCPDLRKGGRHHA